MTRYAIALGSNLEDRVTHLRSAAEQIESIGELLKVSGLYETAPVGGPDQDPYLNAVVVVDSPLDPLDLLARLKSIENEHGRVREVLWGPRTLDLDIVVMDRGVADATGLEVPHPRARERRFVLEPLCDVWPDAVIAPGLTAAEALGRVVDQDVDLLASRWLGTTGPKPGRLWVAGQGVIFLAIAVTLVINGSFPGADGYVLRIVGALALFLGLLVTLLSVRSLGRSLTALPEPMPGAALIETGPYAHARHPIYGALSLMMLGTSLLFASSFAAIISIGLLAFFWAKSGYEERQLRIAYPGYARYRRRVRRRLLPFLF
jgi:2-amino-4-hydroxy-6-hydroxymethyldihydropteridine diphosphokinase